jgi:hypothetical protein
MDDTRLTRRSMLRLVVLGGAAAAAGASLLSACGGGPTCTDTSGLSQAELATRTTSEYVEATPDAAKHCGNCNFYRGPAEGACGTCTVLKGPINPAGHCKLWAAKPA